MQIIKPAWLEDLLADSNWEILGVPIYIGDNVEAAIDWVLDPINDVLTWIDAFWAWAMDFQAEVVEILEILPSFIGQLIDDSLANLEAWWGILTDWWNSPTNPIRLFILDAVSGLAELQVAWSNFWTVVLPDLVDFSWLGEWWQGRLLDIQDLIDSAFVLYSDLWAGWLELKDDIILFFNDPWAWLYDKLDDFIERFW